MDDALSEAMAPVLRDLGYAGIAAPRIDEDDWSGDPTCASAMLRSADGGGTGVHVSRSMPAVERVVAMAEQVQEWAIEELWAQGASTSWPACPHHPGTHPLQAAERDGEAVWICPVDRTAVAPVGALRHP
jgi:hypothetical protein